jgi:iron complex transport system permease protein
MASSPLAARIAFPVLVLALGGALALSLLVGQASLDLRTVLEVLAGRLPGSTAATILLEVRLPRIALAAVVGAALAVSGTAFQGLLRNPLADPFILGTSSGAAFAATLVIALGGARGAASSWLLPGASFGGAFLALVAVYALARTHGRVPVETLLLSGVIVNAFLFALVLLVLALARVEAVEILLWLMGSLSLAVRPGLVGAGAAIVLLASIAIWTMARDLDAMSLGEEQAAHLGVATEGLKRRLFVVVSLLVGAAVSVSGIIGFVGLIVPHLARMVVGAAHRVLLPASALLGAVVLVVADTVARSALPAQELPVGVVTALLGAPFFIVLLRRRKRVG